LLRFVLMVGLVTGFLVCAGAAADTMSGRVVRVVDGDTLVLLVAGHEQERIRLAGIDCPERKQAFGTRAKQALTRRVAGKEVTIEWAKRDRYGRVVGNCLWQPRRRPCARARGDVLVVPEVRARADAGGSGAL
jgi:endonuclease YncB( thermonuclease family)